jgi:hypothetical protein
VKKIAIASFGLLAFLPVLAENISNADRIICSPADVKLCFENGECFDTNPWEVDIPEFLVIDLKKKTISTTRVSGQDRSTTFTALERNNGMLVMQGIESGRAFSFVVEEMTGILTASVARDGVSMSVFGACTDADL